MDFETAYSKFGDHCFSFHGAFHCTVGVSSEINNVRTCVRACVRACVRTCMCVCVCVCVWGGGGGGAIKHLPVN